MSPRRSWPNSAWGGTPRRLTTQDVKLSHIMIAPMFALAAVRPSHPVPLPRNLAKARLRGRGWPRSGRVRRKAEFRAARIPFPDSLFRSDERAVAFAQRPERFVRWDRCQQLVIVPRTFRFFRLLNLEQIDIMELPAVSANLSFAEKRVVGRHLFHFGDDGLAVLGVFERIDGLQIVEHAAIDACLHHGRPAVRDLKEAIRPGSRLIVEVPVEGLGKDQALRGLKAERMHIRQEDEKAGKVLPALDDAEFRRLLDGVDRIAAGIGKANDFCP